MANRNVIELMGPIFEIEEVPTNTGRMVKFVLQTESSQGKGRPRKPQRHKCVAYSALAEMIIKYGKSKDGPREIFAFGENDYYKDSNGNERTQIKLFSIEWIDGKKFNNEAS